MPGHADPIEAVIRQTVQLQRLNNAIARDSSGILRSMFDDIVAELARIDPTGPAALRYQRARVARLIARVEDVTGEAFTEWNRVVRGDLARLGRVTGVQASADLIATLGTAAGAVKMVAPTQNMVKAILDTNPFRGETLKGWAKVQRAGTVRRVRQVVQRGMMEERGISWLVRQVRGGNGVRGVWQTTRQNAEAIVRTAVTEVATQAQLLTYRSNPRVVAEVEWIGTLDHLTCLICQALDGKIMSAANPSETPPAHHQCRCTLVPIPNWDALGLKPPEPGERFARDQDARLRGESLSKQRTQVSGDTKYETWLRGQKPEVVKDILGPGRAKLFLNRKMRLDRMISTDRRILTLNQLEKKLAKTAKPKGPDFSSRRRPMPGAGAPRQVFPRERNPNAPGPARPAARPGDPLFFEVESVVAASARRPPSPPGGLTRVRGSSPDFSFADTVSPQFAKGASQAIKQQISDGTNTVFWGLAGSGGRQVATLEALGWSGKGVKGLGGSKLKIRKAHAVYSRYGRGLSPSAADTARPGGIFFKQGYARAAPRASAKETATWASNREYLRAQYARQKADEHRPQSLRDDAAKRLARLEASVADRWSVSQAAGDDGLFATAAHEAGHAVYYQRRLENAWEDAIKLISTDDRLRVSEYGASSAHELFAEVTATVALGQEGRLPADILKAWRKVTAHLRTGA